MSDIRPPARTLGGLPLAAALCAIAGGYPLVILTSMILFGYALPAVDNRFALMSYAAIMLTFMGAVHWGLAMKLPAASDETRLGSKRDWRAYAASMTPGLIGWLGLMFPTRAGAWLMVAGFGGLIAYDIRCIRMGEAPAWFIRLRLPLAAVASAALVIGIILVKI